MLQISLCCNNDHHGGHLAATSKHPELCCDTFARVTVLQNTSSQIKALIMELQQCSDYDAFQLSINLFKQVRFHHLVSIYNNDIFVSNHVKLVIRALYTQGNLS